MNTQFYYYLHLIIISLTLYGIAVGNFPQFKMNRATIALVGATALILSKAISIEEAYSAIDMNIIVLLFAMMIINGNLRISGFLKLITENIIKLAKTPFQLLLLITLSSGILSALFLNDTIAIVFTPFVIEVTSKLKRNPIPYLIALATSANIGSSATIIGNPQNMIIGISSNISFIRYTLYQIVPSAIGLLLVILVIAFIYRKEFYRTTFDKITLEEVKPYKPLLIKSIVSSSLMIFAFCFGMSIPLAAISGASLLLVTRRLKPERVFREVDWSLLIFFASLFIVTKSIETSGISKYLSQIIQPYIAKSPLSLAVSSALLSNVVSNVPAVLLLRPVIMKMTNPEHLWLILGMATTFAGNLTLIGSVANLIVAETAKRNLINLKFSEYLKTGAIITILSLMVGVLWFNMLFNK